MPQLWDGLPGSDGGSVSVGPQGPPGPPGADGASGTQAIFARKTGDTSVTSNTVSVDAAELGFTLAANTTYVIRWLLRWHTADSTTGIMWGLAGPTSPIGLSVGIWSHISGDGDLTTRALNAYNDAIFGTTGRPATATTHILAAYDVLVANGANAGVIIPRIRSEVSGSAVTVFANSFGQMQEVV